MSIQITYIIASILISLCNLVLVYSLNNAWDKFYDYLNECKYRKPLLKVFIWCPGPNILLFSVIMLGGILNIMWNVVKYFIEISKF